MSLRQLFVFIAAICFFSLFFSACNTTSPVPTETGTVVELTPTSLNTPDPTSTPIPPTATPVPLAAVVNGEGIRLDEFQAQVAQFQASSTITGTNLATDTNTVVLSEMVDQTLLAQGAAESGFTVDDTLLQTRISALESQLGGVQALKDWQSAHGYREDIFTLALKRSIAAAWMRDHIASSMPQTADEVHVLQILLPTKAQADEVYASLQSGKDFQQVASTYDPMTNGDLGWFPRGYLTDPAIEDAAFSLQPGQYSQVIQTAVGYHILYLLEKDPQHPLQPDARRVLQVKSIQDWLSERRKQSEIQVLLP
jgi:peptidyl-prolyl cis-trans isomerase C